MRGEGGGENNQSSLEFSHLNKIWKGLKSPARNRVQFFLVWFQVCQQGIVNIAMKLSYLWCKIMRIVWCLHSTGTALLWKLNGRAKNRKNSTKAGLEVLTLFFSHCSECCCGSQRASWVPVMPAEPHSHLRLGAGRPLGGGKLIRNQGDYQTSSNFLGFQDRARESRLTLQIFGTSSCDCC